MISEPILNVSSCSGVLVTASQSFPPITERPLNSPSWSNDEPLLGGDEHGTVRSFCFLRHDPNGYHRSYLSPEIDGLMEDLLVSVHNRCQVYFPSIDLFFQDRCYSVATCQSRYVSFSRSPLALLDLQGL